MPGKWVVTLLQGFVECFGLGFCVGDLVLAFVDFALWVHAVGPRVVRTIVVVLFVGGP